MYIYAGKIVGIFIFIMIAFQGNIYIENCTIKGIEPLSGFVKIYATDYSYHFNSCYAYPGFVDSHCHLLGLGQKLCEPSLELCQSSEECVVSLINAQTRENWIYARGWNQEKWANQKDLDKKILDYYFPNNPVFLLRIDGHCAWVNSLALELAGINSFTKEPHSGKIERDKSGIPNGILIDDAIKLIEKLLPPYTKEQYKKFLKYASYECLKYGITEIHDMDVNPELLDLYFELDDNGELPIKVHIFLSSQNYPLAIEEITPFERNNVYISGLKFFLDGAIGSRGAALSIPYKDEPYNSGLILTNPIELSKKIQKGIENGFDIAIHAIGDFANTTALDIYENLNRIVKNNNVNLRIEHSQIIQERDIERFSKLDIIASVQPIHCISDAFMAEKRLDESLLKNSYRWRSLINNSIKIIAGSDFPVESPDPLIGINAFTNRIPFNASKPWYPEETITIKEALQAYLETPRKILNQQNEIAIGSKANFIIINNDLDYGIKSNTKVIAVYSNGRIFNFSE